MANTNSWNSDYNSAKGSLLVGNVTRPVVRTVGTNGNALIADSAQTDGVNWGFHSGIITNPLQAAFLAILTTTAANVTGSSLAYALANGTGGGVLTEVY